MGLREPLLDFRNIGMQSRYREFPGFPSAGSLQPNFVPPRGARQFFLRSGDLVSLSGDGVRVALMTFDDAGIACPEVLGLADGPPLATLDLDLAEITGWVRGNGSTLDNRNVTDIQLTEPAVIKARADCTLWVLVPAPASSVVSGTDVQAVEVHVSRAARGPHLPDPLGRILEEFTIPRGSARAYTVREGQYAQIIDVEGQQCSDFMAFRKDALDEGREISIDSTATRSMVRRAYPGPGLLDKFFDRDIRPLLKVVQDTCGRHDTFGLACNARGYEERGFPGHINCSDNMSDALEPHGVARRAAWPAINFFWNTWVDPHTGHILTEESHSRPGDYVALRALSDLTCVSTACPDDIDPINGWNPTDIHVRIYDPEAPIQRAVAHRVKEDSAMTLSRESAFHPRTAALTQDFAPARDLWAPVSYPGTGTLGEYWACRERATLQDMSSLRKYDVVGPDAEHLLQKLVTRDLSRLSQWRGTYALICDETGTVVDDGTLFRLGPQLFRWCCGSEESARLIEALAKQDGLQARLTDMSDTLVNLALQGPQSREILSGLVFTQPHVPDLGHLKWFGVTVARLRDREGAPFMLSRSGYTGELGYELFCGRDAAIPIWDALMEAGELHGLVPMGAAALEIIRIEAGLAAAGAEFAPGCDAWESGLGFAVDLRKDSFVGKASLERNARDPRRVLTGLRFAGNDVPNAGAPVMRGERQVGEVTSATRSPALGCGIAMARIAVEYSDGGSPLEVGMMDGHMKRLPAGITQVPFVDPTRKRARA